MDSPGDRAIVFGDKISSSCEPPCLEASTCASHIPGR